MKTGKYLNRILSMIMVIAMVLSMMPVMAVRADTATTLYLKPNSNWLSDGARFAAYFFGNGDTWVSMTDSNGDGVYEVEVPAGYPSVIFCRMNPNTTANNWDNKWTQTIDLTVPTDGNDCYTIQDGSWDSGTWGKYTYVAPLYTIAGTISSAGWSPENGEKMTDDDADGIFTYTYTDVKAGTYEFKVTNGDPGWSAAWPAQNYSLTVAEDGSNVTITFDAVNKTVSAKAEAVYNVSYNVTDVTSNGSTTVVEGSTYSATLTPADGYKLPDSITVSVGGTTLTDGYSYDSTTGKLEIANVSGNITITAAAVAIYTVYFVNSNGWNAVAAHMWNEGGAGTEWPGVVMTKTDKTVNGFDVYSITVDTAYEKVIFNNNNNGSQTANLDWTNGQYYDVKSGQWYASLEDVPAVDQTATDYYLIGYINGADYGCEGDSANLGTYKFVDGKVTATFTQDSYVFVKTGDNAKWYMSNGYAATSPATLYNTADSSKFTSGCNKLFVPGNVEVEFTLVVNDDDSLTLSYTKIDNPTGTYYVAGDGTLCSVDWSADAEADKMDYDGNGIYTKVYPNVAAGTYNLKVTDGTWDNAWGDNGANYVLKVTATCDVTVTFDSVSKTVTASGDNVSKETTLEIETMYAVGNGDGTWLNGATWDPAVEENAMTETSENVYEITFQNVPKGSSYEFKFAADGAFTHNWGKDEATANAAAYNSSVNIPLEVTYDKADVTLKIDLTNYNHETKKGATYSVTVTEVVEPAPDYYLIGYINGADYGCEGDYTNLGTYKFVDGKLTATFTQDSYVFVKTGDNANWYMSEGYDSESPATLYNTSKGLTDANKLFVPGNVEVEFTLVVNEDDSLTLSYVAEEVTPPADPDYYLVGYINGADNDGDSYKFVDGSLTVELSSESYVLLKDSSGQHYIPAAAVSGATSAVLNKGDWDYDRKVKVPSGKITFTLTENTDGSLTLSYVAEEVTHPADPDYYLVGYINGADNDGDSYKFVDGSLTVELSAESYVLLKDSSGQHYIPAAAVSGATSAVLNKGNWDYDRKVKVPSGKITFTLTENTDGSLTLSYMVVVDMPTIPDGYNTVTIHYLKPTTWGSSVNGYIWTDAGAVSGYEAFNTWPGSPIPANADKDGWYDLVVGTENPQSFNFIFNDGSSQTADLTTGEVTGPTELWVVGNDVYTAAPMEWTHYTATIHFQKPGDWGDSVCLYAWTDGNMQLLGDWPGAVASASTKNAGWYTASVKVEIGSTLNFIFNNNNNGKQTADLTAGVLTGNTELWIDGSGNSVPAPNGWVDESRTVHVPGTFPGPSWDPASNQMTYDPTRGLYVITFQNVTAGTYYYKIAINGSWGENYGAGGDSAGSDIAVNVPTAQDVTIWYSDVTHRTLCSVDYSVDAVVTLTGTGIPEGTKLTDPNLNGIFTETVTLPAGKYSDVTVTFGDYSFTFAEFELTAEKEVTFSFDPSSYLAYHNGSDKKVETGKIFYNTKDLEYKDPYGAVATGEDVTFAIDTGTDASQVSLIVKGRKGIAMEKDGEPVDGVQRWKCTTKFDQIGEYQYYFAITNGSDMVVYTDDNYNDYYKKGDYGTGTIGNLSDIFCYDLVVYKAGYTTPDWMKDAVIYQIFPDRFFDGDETNNQAQTDARGSVDYEYVSDWYLLPENPEMAGKDGYPVYAYKGDGEWSNEIYGGDLEGITERIGYLKALGVNVIYLNPVFSSISNHRYDACDYTQIDPILGTLGDFEELVAVAEANGMKIILDGVFNHVSDDSVYFDRYYKFLGTSEKIGAYPYWAYVYDYISANYSNVVVKKETDSNGNLLVGETFNTFCAAYPTQVEAAENAAQKYFAEEYGISDFSYAEWFVVAPVKGSNGVYIYEGWWGYDSMPVIKSTNGSEYQSGNWAEEIIYNDDASSVTQYWINKGNDGWRLDVANEVSDETWIHFRNSVKALNSDAVIIGEIWADATHYLMGDMYDSVMNYVFRDAVAGFARGYLINRDNKAVKFDDDYIAEDAIATLEILRERYPEEAFYAMMNLVGSHDTSRILSYLDDVEDDRYQKDMDSAFPTYENTSTRAKQLQYVVSFVQFTYAGAPTIYYGDEIGMVGGDDPDDRRAMEWGMGNQELVEWYAKLAAIRAQYPALRTGSVEAFAPSRDVMGYVRRDSSDTLIALANRAASQSTVVLDLEELGILSGNARATVILTDLVTGNSFTAENNKVTVSVDAYRGAILTQNVKSYSVDTDALAPAHDSSYIVPDRAATAPKGTYNTQDGQEVTVGDSLSFTVDAVVNTFVGVSVDGEKVAAEDLDVQIGTVVTLSAELIEELGEGEHEIVIEFEGGSATAKFTVVQENTDQPGGDGEDDGNQTPGGDGEDDGNQTPGGDGEDDGDQTPDSGDDGDQTPDSGDDGSQTPGDGDEDKPTDGEESKPTDGTESTKPGTGDNSSTGDTSGIGIWIVVLGVSLVAVITLLILGLKKKQRD